MTNRQQRGLIYWLFCCALSLKCLKLKAQEKTNSRSYCNKTDEKAKTADGVEIAFSWLIH